MSKTRETKKKKEYSKGSAVNTCDTKAGRAKLIFRGSEGFEKA